MAGVVAHQVEETVTETHEFGEDVEPTVKEAVEHEEHGDASQEHDGTSGEREAQQLEAVLAGVAEQILNEVVQHHRVQQDAGQELAQVPQDCEPPHPGCPRTVSPSVTSH